MNSPFFSVVTPSWNQGKFLRGCVESVLAQGDGDFEHWVFDNCSMDGTAEVAAGFSHLRFCSERDRGQSDAVNKGLRAARGEVVCWLNSDDEYAPGAFERLRRAFADPGTMVVFGDARQVGYGGAGDVVARGRFEKREDFVRWWGGGVKLHQPAVFFRRSVAEGVGILREDFYNAMFNDYWLLVSDFFLC